jgi:ADP-heptose:LPS heptosyltransferase
MQHDFVLLDRSGSMESLWTEALSSVNAYVKKLAEEKVDTGVTLATFDKPEEKLAFDVIRDRITPPTWRPVSRTDAEPRGMTPLNDAVGRIVALAKAGNYDKVAIIIMTDGFENSSKELTVEQAKKLLDECRAKGWQVIFLGANFDNAQQAASLGGARGQTVNSSARNMGKTMVYAASLRSAYGSGAAATMDFAEDKKDELKQQ